MTNPDPLNQFQPGNDVGAQFEPGNQAAAKHGGSAALRRFYAGTPYTGLAAEKQQLVRAAYEAGGILAMQEEIANRAHTLTALYWDAIETAIQQAADGDQEALSELRSHVQLWTRLATVAGRAWKDVRETRAVLDGGPTSYGDVIDALRDQGAE